MTRRKVYYSEVPDLPEQYDPIPAPASPIDVAVQPWWPRPHDAMRLTAQIEWHQPEDERVLPMNLQLDLLDEVDVPGHSGQVLTSLGPGKAPRWMDAGVMTGGAGVYHFDQPTPATTWTINHGRIPAPATVVFDEHKEQVIAEVTNPSDGVTLVKFNAPTAGSARCF